MDHWIDGDRKDEYHHGWANNPDYKDCYCFKWKENTVHQRLYGFLCNPRNGDRFRLCVLGFFDTKTTAESNYSILREAKKLSDDQSVKDEIKRWLKQRDNLLRSRPK